jgi:cytochrome c556
MKFRSVALKVVPMKSVPLKAVALMLAALVLSGCGGVDPASPLGQRKAIFKQMLKTSEDLGGMLRGRLPFDSSRFSENAAKLDTLSHQPWKHFPAVREAEHTSATDAVWQRQARFQELAHALESSTAALVIATRQPSFGPTNVTAAMSDVEGACDACHKEFRNH